jgi:putative flippase GtrA
MFLQKCRQILGAVFCREVIVYVIAGVLATLVNIAVFTILSQIFGNNRWWLSNFPAIIAAIIFAFFTNRIFVFRSHGPFWQELWKFCASRALISLLFEYGAMFLLYNLIGFTATWHFLKWDIVIAKLLTQVLVMAGNYILSKWFIFTEPAKPTRKIA